MADFSKPETRELYEAEVRKRMLPPFYMSRVQAEMLVAALMVDPKDMLHTDEVYTDQGIKKRDD